MDKKGEEIGFGLEVVEENQEVSLGHIKLFAHLATQSKQLSNEHPLDFGGEHLAWSYKS